MASPKSNALQAAFNHLTSASKTAAGVIKTAVDAQLLEAVKEINQEIIAAQGSNIAAQQEHATMLDRVRELEARVVQLEDQSEKLDRYVMHKTDTGVIVYVLDEVEAHGCTPHEICPQCFQRGKISILKPTSETKLWSSLKAWFRVHQCPDCSNNFDYGKTSDYRDPYADGSSSSGRWRV